MAEGNVFHGGDLSWADATFGPPARPWIDLSTGVNPWPYPFSPPAGDAWSRLPDEGAERGLRAAAASHYGAPGADCVAISPGTQMLIQWLPRLRAAGRVAVIGPTYGEHAACWAAAGHGVETVSRLDGLEDRDVVVATNPNNPDGAALDPARLDDLAARLARRGGWLVVDEAFADVVPDVSLASRASLPGRIVLRSFGKFFGLPGLRLGFALAPPEIVRLIRSALGPWAVGGPALAIGAEALGDDGWAREARGRLAARAVELDGLLAGCGCAVIGGTALFRLVADPRAAALFRALADGGILVRHFPDRPDWLRFGLPGDEAAFDRLGAALAAWRAADAGAVA